MTQQPRLKSSFIYLANAVQDLAGNWALIAVILTPLVLLASLCLLPDALNLQHQLAQTLTPGLHSVGYFTVQVPYNTGHPPPPPLFSPWTIRALHLLFLMLTLVVNLVALCALSRTRSRQLSGNPGQDAIAIYRAALQFTPAFALVMIMQLIVIAVTVVILMFPIFIALVWMYFAQVPFTIDFFDSNINYVLFVLLSFPAFIWLYFSQYALVMDNRHGWSALLYSRDLMRGIFFKVATRITVFLAVWSGYNSWAAGVFVAVSLLLSLLGAITGFIWAGVFVADLLAVAVAYVTTVFFFAAGVRLYTDLNGLAYEQPVAALAAEPPPTAPLPSAALESLRP